MKNQAHWDTVYRTKAPDAVSWYRPHLERSLELIQAVVPDFSASIVDVGGGESTLVDDLLAKGYRDVSVLDISQAAIEVAKKAHGPVGALCSLADGGHHASRPAETSIRLVA